jgi:hypothetical protein
VISEDVSHIAKEIMPPGTQGMYYSGQLKIMSGILLFMRAQLTWGVCNHTTFLHENTAKPSIKCVTVHIEGLCDIWLCQHRGCSQQLLQSSECFIAISIPNKLLLFLQKICNGFGNLREVRNKSTIVASQVEKASNLMHNPWLLPIQHLSNLAQIHRYSLRRYHVT